MYSRSQAFGFNKNNENAGSCFHLVPRQKLDSIALPFL